MVRVQAWWKRMNNDHLEIGQCATLACLLEVTAPKPGNVHRGADFEDLRFSDFLASAVAIAPAMQEASSLGVGRTVAQAIQATRAVVATNTNLGTVLLMAPLAAVPRDESLADGIAKVLSSLTARDSELVYAAIGQAKPGGMGKVDEMDVGDQPPSSLFVAMKAAAERDLVAAQYVNGFSTVLDFVVPNLLQCQSRGWTVTNAIIHTQMKLMSEFPDSLIARKCGVEVADQSSVMARRALDAGHPDSPNFSRQAAELDFWLRSDGHRRNPGTTADLIAAGLFATLRDNRLERPFH